MEKCRMYGLVIGFVLLLTGCRQERDTEVILMQNTEKSMKYQTEYVSLENMTFVDTYYTCLRGNSLYYRAKEDNKWVLYESALIHKDAKEGLGETRQIMQFMEEEGVTDYHVTLDGDIICVVRVGDTGLLELRRYDAESELQWTASLPEELTITLQLLSDTENIYVATPEQIYAYAADGQMQGDLNWTGNHITQIMVTDKGNLYAVEQAEQTAQFMKYDAQRGDWEKRMVFSREMTALRSNSGAYFTDGTYLIRYNEEMEELEVVLSLQEQNIQMLGIYQVECREEGSYLISSFDTTSELALISPGEEGVLPVQTTDGQVQSGETAEKNEKSGEEQETVEKTRIVFATAVSSGLLLNNEISNINRRYPEYLFVMENYMEQENGKERLHASLLGEDSPDVLEIMSGGFRGEYENYVEKGYLEDLTPYFEASDKVSLEDYLPWIVEDFTIDGKIYALPSRFSIQALAVPRDVMGDKSTWTIEEYLDFLEQYPNARTSDGGTVADTKELILGEILLGAMDAFVDVEKGTASFDGKRFQDVLRRIQALNIRIGTESVQERIAEGEVLMRTMYIFKTENLYQQENQLWGGRQVTLMGYPSASQEQDKQNGAWISYSTPLAILSRSEHKDGAWLFVQNRLAGALLYQETGYDFPAGKEAFTQKMAENMVPNYRKDEDGNYILDENGDKIEACAVTADGKILDKAVTQDEVDRINAVMKNGFTMNACLQEIRSMVIEEAGAYFTGDKSLEQVVDVIQNRVQLVLDERG